MRGSLDTARTRVRPAPARLPATTAPAPPGEPSWLLRAVLVAALVVAFAGVLYLAALPLTLATRAVLAAAIVAALALGRRVELRGFPRLGYLLAGSFLTLSYFFWRTTSTLGFHDPASFTVAVALYLAEIYGITVFLLGLFVNAEPYERRPVPLPADESRWPSVDVMVPSYNEEPELLETTLLAALQIRWPKDRLRVYLLDDGGTRQKRNDPDPDRAREARERHERLRELCRRIGAIYLTRDRNEHAKAGNVNAALPKTDGELVLILDADHVPTEDILVRTAGLFLADPRLFLVQTPHFFINPDPIEKNLGTFQQMPAENEMFYGVIQKGLDFWGASFFCGSAALLRRRYLEEIGGISGVTITEDAETALELHARGYTSAYISRPMISGLQPESFTGFVVQRVRWAQGMVQIFLLRNPLLLPGLAWRQRLCYLSSSFFWFFGYARVLFVIAPSAHLLLGLQIYDASLVEFATYALPHVLAAVLISHQLYGRVRWTLTSELYELMQSLFALGGIIKVIRNPRAPKFIVTPKGELLDREFISPLSRPFYALLVLACVSLAAGVVRLVAAPAERDATVITMAWTVFNMLVIFGGLGALLERQQVRANPRVPCRLPGRLMAGRQTLDVEVTDLSVGGAGLVFHGPLAALRSLPERGFLEVTSERGETFTLPVELRHARETRPGRCLCGTRFAPAGVEDKARIVRLVHGDSGRWLRMLEQRHRPVGILDGAGTLVRLGMRQAGRHLMRLATAGVRRLGAAMRRPGEVAP
ncbi:MAG: UDP-forming cellulose synthase catalytic subunit [Acidobacteriota bacterium]